jgi:hypothetical protein
VIKEGGILMTRLPELPLEIKGFLTAALVFAGVAVLMAIWYIIASHHGIGDTSAIGASDIAALYTGPGVSLSTLISLAHIHLLGLFAVFTIVGFIFLHSTLSAGWKLFWSVLPYVAFLVDLSGWFLTKIAGEGFVWMVIIGGALFSFALGVMILTSLYQIWIMPMMAKSPKQAL